MLVRLVLLFTILPFVELALLIWIAKHTSLWFTLGLVIATGVVGASLARHQGLQCVQQLRSRVDQGKLATEPLLDGLMILVAAALLVTPGVITDSVGFLLLTPPFRRLVRQWLRRRIRSSIIGPFPGPQGSANRDDDTIDVESRPPDDPNGP